MIPGHGKSRHKGAGAGSSHAPVPPRIRLSFPAKGETKDILQPTHFLSSSQSGHSCEGVGVGSGEQVQLLPRQKPGEGSGATRASGLSGSELSRREVAAPRAGNQLANSGAVSVPGLRSHLICSTWQVILLLSKGLILLVLAYQSALKAQDRAAPLFPWTVRLIQQRGSSSVLKLKGRNPPPTVQTWLLYQGHFT